MSRRALLLALAVALSVPASLRAQSEVGVLRRRLANLSEREGRLVAAVAVRDTAAWTRERFVPIGKEPLVLLVPGWTASASAPAVTALVETWTARAGAVFTDAPAETVRVAVRSDTAGWSRTQVEMLLATFPFAVLGRAGEEAQVRIRRRLGSRFLTWTGAPLFPTNGPPARRGAILALARDTTGVGPRCLEGEVRDCLGLLAHDVRSVSAVRRSLLAFTLDRAGPAGWQLLARDTLGAPEERIGRVAGRGYEAAVEAWLQDLRSPPDRDPGDPWLFVVTAAWSFAFAALFLWRLRWHRG